MDKDKTKQPFRLTQSDAVISEADGTANQWSDIWKYQVPMGVQLVIEPEAVFAAYLEDTSPAEVGSATCRVKIEKRDPSESDVQILYGPDIYLSVKEFQDKSKKARLSVPSKGLTIDQREYLVVSVYDDAAIDASDSYFELLISKVRRTIKA